MKKIPEHPTEVQGTISKNIDDWDKEIMELQKYLKMVHLVIYIIIKK